MKNIDNDIEQFEKNLIEIDEMRKQISELKESLDKMLRETVDIDRIKNGINQEIVSIYELNENSTRQINGEIKSLNEIAVDIKKYMERDVDSIIEPIKLSMEELSKKIDNIYHCIEENTKKTNKEIIILLIISIVIGIIGIFI